MDINSPHSIKSIVPELSETVEVDCSVELYCGMPYPLPVLNFIKKTTWVSGPPVHVPIETTVTLNSKTLIEHNRLRMNITVNGKF